MTINFIPNDPVAGAAAPAMRQKDVLRRGPHQARVSSIAMSALKA